VHKIASLNAYVGCAEPQRQHSSQFLICHACGSVAELDNADVRKLLADKADTLGFRIDCETIEIQGLCGACQRKNG
jgi:Fur family zinc uptake transcriptional regulator